MKRSRASGRLPATLALLALASVALFSCGGDSAPELDADGCTSAPADLVDTAVCRGKANFRNQTLAGLGGNGRACADCHIEAENFQLTPAAAQARLAKMIATGVDDPLFRAIDANDFRVNGAAARDFSNLTELGLVRVTIALPANVKLLDCGASVPCPASARPTAETVADVWRSVPSILDAGITGPDAAAPTSLRGPNRNGGYQLDARIDTLQNQALSALRNHGGTTVDPPARFVDDLAVFQNAQFSTPGVKALAAAIAASASPLPDPDPVLTTVEMGGKAVFNRACAQCHGNTAGHPSSSTPIQQGVQGTATELIRYHVIASTCPRPVDTVTPPRFAFAPCSASQMRNVRTYEITNCGVAPSGTPCGGAATLEEVVEHYKQFYKRVAVQNPAAPLLTTQPGVVPPVIDRPFTDAEVPALLAYLRKL